MHDSFRSWFGSCIQIYAGPFAFSGFIVWADEDGVQLRDTIGYSSEPVRQWDGRSSEALGDFFVEWSAIESLWGDLSEGKN